VFLAILGQKGVILGGFGVRSGGSILDYLSDYIVVLGLVFRFDQNDNPQQGGPLDSVLLLGYWAMGFRPEGGCVQLWGLGIAGRRDGWYSDVTSVLRLVRNAGGTRTQMVRKDCLSFLFALIEVYVWVKKKHGVIPCFFSVWKCG
jgi:hypothetical protein